MTPHAVLGQTLRSSIEVWGLFLLLVVAAAVIGWLFERFVIKSIQRLAKSTKTEIDDILVSALHPAMVVAIFIAGVWYGVRFLGARLPPTVVEWTPKLGLTLVLFLVALITARIVRGLLHYRAARRPRLKPIATMGSRVTNVVVYFVAFLIILDYYGLNITPLLTSLGIAGLAVALALQDTLTNFFAGVWIQVGRTIRPCHFVRLEEQKLEGYVVEVSWRTTKIRTLPNNIIIVPNAKLAQSVITDYHLPTPQMALLISVNVGYEVDPDRVEKILVDEALAAAETTPGLLKDPPPFVRFIPGFGEYALQFTLIVQVAEFVDQYLAQHEIRKRIVTRFRSEGIQLPYPTRLQMQVAPPSREDRVPGRAEPEGRAETG